MTTRQFAGLISFTMIGALVLAAASVLLSDGGQVLAALFVASVAVVCQYSVLLMIRKL